MKTISLTQFTSENTLYAPAGKLAVGHRALWLSQLRHANEALSSQNPYSSQNCAPQTTHGRILEQSEHTGNISLSLIRTPASQNEEFSL